ECEEWRERTLGRIVREENPSLVVTSMLNRYRAREDGKGLEREASNEAVVEGYVSTLEKLRSGGAEVAVIEDVPHPDKNIPECVSRSLDRLQNCAFPRSKALTQPRINVRAAEEVEGASLIDPTPVVCPEETCPAVIGDVLVYRNGAHLTRTYVNTLTPWLGERLPEPAQSANRAG
ncbi:MAG TPA: SGNH hydrolase domain-containing protein, partial [Rubrobacter sp.]|nr:SGNH hydrolase domain-containing protein [Rubrobacter sp.]